jgi:hypothetical protein
MIVPLGVHERGRWYQNENSWNGFHTLTSVAHGKLFGFGFGFAASRESRECVTCTG